MDPSLFNTVYASAYRMAQDRLATEKQDRMLDQQRRDQLALQTNQALMGTLKYFDDARAKSEERLIKMAQIQAQASRQAETYKGSGATPSSMQPFAPMMSAASQTGAMQGQEAFRKQAQKDALDKQLRAMQEENANYRKQLGEMGQWGRHRERLGQDVSEFEYKQKYDKRHLKYLYDKMRSMESTSAARTKAIAGLSPAAKRSHDLALGAFVDEHKRRVDARMGELPPIPFIREAERSKIEKEEWEKLKKEDPNWQTAQDVLEYNQQLVGSGVLGQGGGTESFSHTESRPALSGPVEDEDDYLRGLGIE